MRRGGVGGAALVILMLVAVLPGCGGADDDALDAVDTTVSTTVASTPVTAPTSTAATLPSPSADPITTQATAGATTTAGAGGTAGAGAGTGAVPAEGRPVDTSNPTTVVGDGTPAGCTSAAFVAAVAAGGVITFDCGPDPVVITVTGTARIFNDTGPDIVIDGGGLVTLSGGGSNRILYLNTCDEALGWTTSHCDDQDHPRLTVQNLTFADGNAPGGDGEGGGGAIYARGGRLTVIDSRFVGNRCVETGPDVGGAAIRAFDQHDDLPVLVVGSTFESGVCSNGGGVSSIGVSWRIVNSVFSGNRAVGVGANPARDGTPGGGSGGAIYTDGDGFTVELIGTRVEGNHANEGGGAVFFVSNDRTGTLTIRDSVLAANPSDGFETGGFPGIFFLGAADPTTPGSTLS